MVKIVVVTGWDRSGSTLVANALGSLDRSISVGEVVNIWERGILLDRPCACGRQFSLCEFWAPIVRDAFGDDASSIRARAVETEPVGNLALLRRQFPVHSKWSETRFQRYLDALVPLYRSMIEHADADLIVDASKTPWHTAAVLELPNRLTSTDLDVTVLHVVRDPRAAAFSLRKSVPYDSKGNGEMMMDRHGTTKATLAWLYRNLLTERVWGSSNNYVRLRYEDFASNPAHGMNELTAAIGLDGATADAGSNWIRLVPSQSHSVSGNPMRFQTGIISVKVDDEWVTGLTPGTKRVVGMSTFGQLRRYGYR